MKKNEHKKIRLDQQHGLVAEGEDMHLVPLDALSSRVATHSPFIVGDRDDLMVGLGDQA